MAVTEMSGEFDLTMPLAKVWEDEAGELRFEGVASSTRLDRQQERMTPHAIRKMATQSGLDLLPSHRAGALEELGVVEEAWVDNESFRVAGRLDRSNPQAQRLFDQVVGGRRYGLSVGGRVTKAFWKWDEEAGRQVRHIDDVELDHVAVCRPEAAANPDTYLQTLAKAAEAVIGEEMPDDEATLARVGRAAIEAARSLWPFAKGEPGAGPGETTEEANAAADEVAALRKEVSEALDEVRAAIDGLRKSEAAAEERRTAVDHGRPQGIAGQESAGKSDPWAGVV